LKHRVRLCLLCASLLGWAGLVAADPPQAPRDTSYAIDIPAQNLGDALQAFALASHHKLLYSSDLVAGKTSTAIKGQFTTEEGVRRILANTSLKYEVTTNGLVMIRAANVADPPDDSSQRSNTGQATKEGKKSSSDGFRLAQANPGQAQGAASVEKPDEKSSEKKTEQLQVVIVTGSRIPTTAGSEVQPVRNYTREDIETSGQTTIGEFLNTLPDVSTYQNSSMQLGFAGMQTVQLHGLPVGATLILLDGRRLETNISGFFDLSNIPLAAVERIEISPVGASAIYGADGLAGAVNTILRKNFNGFEANATWEHASGVNDPSASLAWGKSWERGSVSLIGSYQERGELLGTQREPWSLSGFPINAPSSTVSALGSDVCAPGNVYSVDGSNLPGLSSSESAIPAGITGRPTTGQFAATAGRQNLCNPQRYFDITPHTQREGALLSAHYDVAESMELFTEVLFSHQHVRYQAGPQISGSQSSGGTLAAANPYNPFGQDVNVSFAYPGTGSVAVQSTSLIRPLIGVRGAFLSDWHYEATAYLSRDQFHDVSVFTDSQLISNALASSDPATALNPFASGVPGTPQLLSSLINPAVDTTRVTYDDRTVSVQGFLRGPVLQLPAGALQAVMGGEYSQDKQDTTENLGTFIAPPRRLQRNTYAVFSEARIPLQAAVAPAPGGERLALTLAGRYDHSNDYGGKATWQSGLLWRATDTLSFRGGYGLSYQAPQLLQISGSQNVFVLNGLGGVTDPFRGNQVISYPLRVVAGPNFNLKPETGDAFTLGLQYSSQALPGLQTSLTWYDLKISNYIGIEQSETIVANPDLFPGAVVRAPPTAQDQQQGFLGVITQFNNLFYNFGDLRVSGFDADISYAIDTRAGQFTPSLSIANVYRWQSALLPGTPAIDAVSQATLFGVGWAPRWKGTAALAWKQGPLSMNLAGRYIGKYLDYQDFVPNTNEIGNTWIFDFNARYEVGQALASTNRWLARSYVAFGAVNLLNKTPLFSYSPFWYDVQEYDIRGRYLHLNVGVRF
jgi:iron complex outermembrane receptor protein